MLLGFNAIWVCGLVRGNVILWVCAEIGFLGGCGCVGGTCLVSTLIWFGVCFAGGSVWCGCWWYVGC